MQVAVIEIESHAEVVNYVVDVLHPCTSLRVYSFRDLSSELTFQASSLLVSIDAQSLESFLAKSFSDFLRAKCDTLIITTLGANRSCWRILRKHKIMSFSFIHNVNYSFKLRPRLVLTPFGILRRFKYLLNGSWQSRLVSQYAFRGYILPSTIVKDSAMKMGCQRPVLCLPWTISNVAKEPKIEKNDIPLRIVLPGSLKRRGRNWAPVFKLIKESSRTLELYFLGRNYGKESVALAREFRRVALDRHTLFFYTDYVSQQEFDRICDQADLFILPFSSMTTYASVHEIQGVTKISGAEHDALHYNRPVFIDSQYVTNPFLAGLVSVYDDGDALVSLVANFDLNTRSSLEKERPLEEHQQQWLSFLANT